MSMRQHTSAAPSAPPSPLERAWCQFALCAIVFLAITLPWATGSDLWFDETMTLRLYVLPANGIWQILRNYGEANNHFLNSIITRLWLGDGSDSRFSEIMLRLPCLLAGLGTLATISWGWRRFLGWQYTLLCGAIMAASPIFCPFAYQMRGYSYGMLLAALATAAAFHLAYTDASPLSWQCLAFFSSLLLPFAAPTSAMAVMPCALMVFTEQYRRTHAWRTAARQTLPTVLGGILGVAYYFTLWDAFRHASKSAGGWTSAGLVAGHLLLAFTIHGLVLLWPATLALKQKQLAFARRALPLAFHAAAVIAVLLATAMFTTMAPFPRVFTALLPGFTASLAFFCANPAVAFPWSSMKAAAVLAILWGVAVIQGSNQLTARQISHGKAPQNLLQQYYRGDTSCSEAIAALVKSPAPAPDVILTPAVDEFTFDFYWILMAQTSFPNTEVFAVNRLPATFVPPPRTLALARNATEAEAMLKSPVRLIGRFTARQLYEPAPIAP